MKLSALTAGVLQQAIAIYQNLAYGAAGKPRKNVEATDKCLEDLLAMFQKEQIEPIRRVFRVVWFRPRLRLTRGRALMEQGFWSFLEAGLTRTCAWPTS